MAERSRDGRGLVLRVAQQAVLPLTVAFSVLTAVNFLAPVLVLGPPDSLREPIRAIYDVLLLALITVQLGVLAVATPLFIYGPTFVPSRRLVLLTLGAAILIAKHGSTGPAGPGGAQGPQGPAGATGAAGIVSLAELTPGYVCLGLSVVALALSIVALWRTGRTTNP